MVERAHFTHIDEVTPENMDKGDGWFITEFRLPFSGREGSATTMFHARFMPGAIHKKHRHENCEEIYFIVSGHGIAGAGGATEEVRPGHFHYVPADTEHWLINLDENEPIEVVGWYLGAGSVVETGYAYMGDVTDADAHGPHSGYDVGALSHYEDAAAEAGDAGAGWAMSEFRTGLGERQGIGHTAWRSVIAKGEAHKVHRNANADTFVFVVSGAGRAGVGEEVVDVRSGSCIHVPAGAAHWLEGGSAEPLVAVGLYDGAGSVVASGYEFLGEVPAAAE
jgi:mannose-6-phosphate isomerase-like protein (cupin superfamily)